MVAPRWGGRQWFEQGAAASLCDLCGDDLQQFWSKRDAMSGNYVCEIKDGHARESRGVTVACQCSGTDLSNAPVRSQRVCCLSISDCVPFAPIFVFLCQGSASVQYVAPGQSGEQEAESGLLHQQVIMRRANFSCRHHDCTACSLSRS